MSKIRRVNIFGGAGSGKSTMAAWVYSQLKINQLSVEFVPEFIKSWVFIKRNPESFDEVILFAQQLHQEDIYLDGGADLVVCECPNWLACAYGTYYNVPGVKHIWGLAETFEKAYPSVNVFLDRTGMDYKSIGRYETLEKAKEIDDAIKDVLVKAKLPFEVFQYNARERILTYVLQKIREE